ncbi:MAG: hypothetical protein H6908_02395 [Hyphomicrobiales bacterium]|nr:hypothetical protein [Rickettsiales bacterium]MCP5361481.1 hypothetical protein [Hyphomicrobiales bacterium]
MAEMICMECQYVGKPKRQKRGSTKAEIIAWLLFPFGLPYVFWRILHKFPVCRHCGSTMLTSTESAVGKRLLEKQAEELEQMVRHAPPQKEIKPAEIQLPEVKKPSTQNEW